MAGPWDKFQKNDGPWTKYSAPAGDETSLVGDILRSGASGVRQGIEASIGGFGDAANINASGASWLAEKLGAGEGTSEFVGNIARRITMPGVMSPPTTSDLQDAITTPAVERAGLEDVLAYKPQTMAGEYSRTIGEFLPASMIGSGSLPGRVLKQAVLPALGSETAGQFTEGSSMEPYARIAGALVGSIAPDLLRRAVTPFPASPERLSMADTLASEGVDLTAGQRTGNDRLRHMESELGGYSGQRFMERQGEQFTSAALKRAGIDATRATPEVMDEAFTRIGKSFDDLAAQTSIPFDAKVQDDLLAAVTDYQGTAATPAPIVERMMSRASDLASKNGGVLPGEAYQNIRSEIGSAIKRSDGPTQMALRDVQEALDDAVGRAMPADFVKKWDQARNQYRNMLVLEKAAAGAGENVAGGLLSPSQLRGATVNQNRRAYVRGKGDFAELARAGEGVMKPLPNSGTASRTSARNIGVSLATLLGAGGGSVAGGPFGAVAGALAGSALPAGVGKAMLSGPGRAYLGNQLLTNRAVSPQLRAVISALMGSDEARQAIGRYGAKPATGR